jgi:hypothetical protein
MGYIFRITALDNKWGGVIKKGECFTIICNSSSPNALALKNLLQSMGRTVLQSTSLPSMGQNENFKQINKWLIERLGKITNGS